MIRIKMDVTKPCPYIDKEMDIGTVEIEFDGVAPELHQLGAWILDIAQTPMTHEDFTVAVANHVNAKVTTTWRTGKWEVECSI